VAGKIKAVHNGVSEHFKPVSYRDCLNTICLKYQLPEKYLLFFGSKDPRKNTARVVQAFAEYNQRNTDHHLVLMGYGNDDLNELLKVLDLSDLREKIVLPGYVADKDLPGIYQGAVLFLFPSLREGFGIPIIEAMACGTPVVTSNTSSMPEVAGDAACLVDPFRVSAIIEGIERVLGNKGYRDKLVDKGFKQKDKFSWRTMAQRVLQVYDQVYNDIQA
jgi:glycosyltransferase involved in cell wall biosynthesis